MDGRGDRRRHGSGRGCSRGRRAAPDNAKEAATAELRHERGWNQTVFGEKMGWSLQSVSRVESGAENFRLTRLVDIANVLEVELVALLQPPKSLEVRRGRPPTRSSRGARPTLMSNVAQPSAQREVHHGVRGDVAHELEPSALVEESKVCDADYFASFTAPKLCP